MLGDHGREGVHAGWANDSARGPGQPVVPGTTGSRFGATGLVTGPKHRLTQAEQQVNPGPRAGVGAGCDEGRCRDCA